jgi:hypothetical protein
MPYRISPKNAPSSCCYLSKVLLQKRDMRLYKVIHKKQLKNRQVPKISKTMDTLMPTQKKRKERRIR